MFVASRMLVQIFLESYGTVAAVSAPLVMHVSSSSYHILTRCDTLVALSAPLVMPLCDSHIPINVPFTFRDEQPCLIFYRARLRDGSRATASIEPLSSLVRLSIMSSLERRRRRCRLLVRRLVQSNWMASAGPRRPAQCDSQDCIFSCIDSRGTHPLCVYVREYGMWYVRGYVLGEGGVNASTSRGRNSKLEG